MPAPSLLLHRNCQDAWISQNCRDCRNHRNRQVSWNWRQTPGGAVVRMVCGLLAGAASVLSEDHKAYFRMKDTSLS